MKGDKNSSDKFRFIDFFVVLLCLSGAFYSLNLFRNDLFQTINSRNETPIGTISFKRNTVQRKMSDRVLWDRLINQSPVYSDDMIRVAELSEASIDIGGNSIMLNENTLVRIQIDKDTGQLMIELSSGNMDLVTAAEGESVVLNIMGREVEAGRGAALNAAAGNEGMAVQINGGAVRVKEEGRSRELAAGSMVALDREGLVRQDPAAVALLPRPNARFSKTGPAPVNVDFAWNRINIPPNETLRLEISGDQNFSRIAYSAGNLDSTAAATLDAGLWNWRLVYKDEALSSGRVTVTDLSGPQLLSPSPNEPFYYETELPKIHFQWAGMEDVSGYILEIDYTPEFRNPIQRQLGYTSYADSGLENGTWYWRVLPVFNFEGGSPNPRVSSFRIVKNDEERSVIEEPKEIPPPPPEPPKPPARVRLEVPVQDASIPGLTALRQETAFRWSSEEAVGRSRFVLSRNSSPLSRPEYEINDPGRTVNVGRLGEGLWYWTVEARTINGDDISAQDIRRLRVLAVPLLPVPSNPRPSAGYSISIDEIKRENVDFSWSSVTGANAYIFTLYRRVTANERSLIVQTEPVNRTNWSVDIKTLGRGNFLWSVEAVNIGNNRVIEQRGVLGENTFVIDFPRPGKVRIIDGPEVSDGE